MELLPFNGCRRFGGDVVADTVDAANFVDDAAGYFFEHVVWNTSPVSGHEVSGGNCTQSQSIIVGSCVAHYANGTHGGQYCEVLADLGVETCFCDFIAPEACGGQGAAPQKGKDHLIRNYRLPTPYFPLIIPTYV